MLLLWKFFSQNQGLPICHVNKCHIIYHIICHVNIWRCCLHHPSHDVIAYVNCPMMSSLTSPPMSCWHHQAVNRLRVTCSVSHLSKFINSSYRRIQNFFSDFWLTSLLLSYLLWIYYLHFTSYYLYKEWLRVSYSKCIVWSVSFVFEELRRHLCKSFKVPLSFVTWLIEVI